MRLNIIDPSNLELIGVLSNYSSVQWSPTFNTPDGTFTINCSVDYAELMKVERYVENTEELDHIGVIKRVQTISSNQKESLQIQGIMLEKDIFYKRVLKAWVMYQDMHPVTVLDNIIALCMTDPAEPDRKMNLIGDVISPKESDLSDIEKTQYSANYPNLGDEVFSLIQGMDIGVKARINRTTNKIDITFYKGNDYTLGSDEPVVFSPERGTVLETTYAKDSSQNFTELTIIGENNVILEAERERDEDEPIIEKSMDLSSEIPYPTYTVEKPNEDGGNYYRYKKYNPPSGFITNRDVWEKYEVEKVETTSTRYREKEVTTTNPYSVNELMKNPELLSKGKVIDASGLTFGSSISTKQAIANLKKNSVAGGLPVALGLLPIKKTSTSKSVSKSPLKAQKTSTKASKKSKKVTKKSTKSNNTKGTSSNKSPIAGGLTTAAASAKNLVNVLGKIDVGGNVVIETSEIQLEEYNVTTVTYNTKDFLEYVYVNPGEPPSGATKIIQGSVGSGDVMYYENFEELKVSESQYREVLMKKAKEYLKTFVVSESVVIEPYKLSNMVYGINYQLGDLVTARNKIYGFSVDLRLTGVTEVWDSKGYSIDISLGDNVPTLTNRIKLLSKGGI
nr:MAG TPA: hypothetical protein [Caudoviricetes sp.]